MLTVDPTTGGEAIKAGGAVVVAGVVVAGVVVAGVVVAGVVVAGVVVAGVVVAGGVVAGEVVVAGGVVAGEVVVAGTVEEPAKREVFERATEDGFAILAGELTACEIEASRGNVLSASDDGEIIFPINPTANRNGRKRRVINFFFTTGPPKIL